MSIKQKDELPDLNFDILVCDTAVIEPKVNDWSVMECGVPSCLCIMILECSGALATPEYVQNAIASKKYDLSIDTYSQMESIIEHVFPFYNKEKFMDISYDDLIEIYVKADFIIKHRAEQEYIHQTNLTNEAYKKQNQIQQELRATNEALAKAKKDHTLKRVLGPNAYGSGQI